MPELTTTLEDVNIEIVSVYDSPDGNPEIVVKVGAVECFLNNLDECSQELVWEEILARKIEMDREADYERFSW